MGRFQRFGPFIAAGLAVAGLASVSAVSAAAATAHPPYPLGNAKHCRANYFKLVETQGVSGHKQQYVACVYKPYHLVVSISDLTSSGAYRTGDEIVVTVTGYEGTEPVTTGLYDVNTFAPTENAGMCGMGIMTPTSSPTGYCELIFSQPGEFKITESYGYGNYGNLATAAQEVTIYQGGP